VEADIMKDLDTLLKTNPTCLEILSRYGNLSSLLAGTQEGPEAAELCDVF
jgi:hypothetical protein